MAQLILGPASDEVLSVRADGEHPGRNVMENPPEDPQGWRSRPRPPYRRVLVLGAPTAAFNDLLARDQDPTTGTPRSQTKRVLVINFLPAQAAEIAVTRTLTLPVAAAVRRARNPRASVP